MYVKILGIYIVQNTAIMFIALQFQELDLNLPSVQLDAISFELLPFELLFMSTILHVAPRE